MLHNEFTGEGMGEVDVIGVRLHPEPEVWLCEVATHVQGLQYDQSFEKSKTKILQKIDRAEKYAARLFRDHRQHVEVWSPVVPVGQTTTWMREVEEASSVRAVDVHFVVNEDYTAAVQQVVDAARGTASTTGEPAFRMLQILTRLKGAPLNLRP